MLRDLNDMSLQDNSCIKKLGNLIHITLYGQYIAILMTFTQISYLLFGHLLIKFEVSLSF